MTQIEKYIERLKTLQNLYKEGQPQHNAFGIAITEANEMLIKNLNMENKISTNHENGNDANYLLADAASWWDNLTKFKRELYIGRHYSDDTPTPDKINTLYKMYKDCSSEDLEQVSSCRLSSF